MIPNYAPPTELKTVKLKVPRAVADAMIKQGAGSSSSSSNGNGGSRTTASSGSGTAATSSSSSSPASSNGSSPGSSGAAQQPAEGSEAGSEAAAGPAGPRPAGLALAISSSTPGGGELVEVEQQFPVPVQQPPALAALHRLQSQKAAVNAALGLSVPSELALLFTHHLAHEMLWRAVILAGVAWWTTSLLNVPVIDDYLFTRWSAGTPQVGRRRVGWGWGGCCPASWPAAALPGSPPGSRAARGLLGTCAMVVGNVCCACTARELGAAEPGYTSCT